MEFENRLVTKNEVVAIFEISTMTFNKWVERANGDGKIVIQTYDGKYDLVEIANYLAKRSNTGRPMPKLKDCVNRILNQFKNDSVVTKPKAKPEPKEVDYDFSKELKSQDTEQRIKKKTKKQLEGGLEDALDRIKRMEVLLADKVENSLDDEEGMLSMNINNWQKILEVLRKTELDCLKVLQEKKILIRFDECVKAYEKGILPVKQKLQSFPVQLSVLLENQPAKIIQQVLEQEVTKLLNNISNIWGGDND